MAKRIQRKRTKGWKMPEGAVYVGRPSKWGNPFPAKEYGVEGSLNLFCKWITGKWNAWDVCACPELENPPPRDFEELRGKNLACWCRLCEAHKDGKPMGIKCPDCDPCHVDMLLELANETR